MSGYLGVPGAMAELRYRGGLVTKTERPVSSRRTLGGKQKAFISRTSRREWEVSFDLLGSEDAHGVLAVASQLGPVAWYPADAAIGNLLSPQASTWDPIPTNATASGLVQLPDGSIAQSVAHTGSGAVTPGNSDGSYEGVQVRSGIPVTVSAWGRGGIRFTGLWRDATGASTTNFASPTQTFSGWQWRSATFTPPIGAASLSLTLSGGIQYARPSVSWGSQGMDRPGRGCPKAVVHGLSESLTTIDDLDAYGSLQITITEVG